MGVLFRRRKSVGELVKPTLKTIFDLVSTLPKFEQRPPHNQKGIEVERVFSELEYHQALNFIGGLKSFKAIIRELWLYDPYTGGGLALAITKRAVPRPKKSDTRGVK